MDTVKVDVRRLQLLNDRINQCLDALNQVRFSVHGLSHAGNLYQQGPYQQSPQQTGAFGSQFQAPGIGPGQPGISTAAPFAGGLSHSGFAPGVQGIYQGPQQQTPFGPSMAFQGAGQIPSQLSPWGQPLSPWGQQPGLAHASRELETDQLRPLWADPVLTGRVMQTFPYAQAPISPVVSLY
jgi:hypothetical protein